MPVFFAFKSTVALENQVWMYLFRCLLKIPGMLGLKREVENSLFEYFKNSNYFYPQRFKPMKYELPV